MRSALFFSLSLLLLPEVAAAHDLWLLPKGGTPEQPLTLELAQGADFPKSSGAPKQASFEKFHAVGPDGDAVELVWLGSGKKKAQVGFVPKKAGVYVAGAVTNPKLIELDAAAFNQYLVADGMADVWLRRAKEKTLEAPAKERYQKWVKAIVKVGDGPGDPTKPLGHTLEIVPLEDPTKLAAGDTLPIEVRFRGEPLAGAWVGWDAEGDGPGPAGLARTDEKGRVRIPIAAGAGKMALRLTHMTQPKKKDYEWFSFWTTLTFER